MKYSIRTKWFFSILFVLLAACNLKPAPATPLATLPAQTVQTPVVTQAATSSALPSLTPSLLPDPTETPVPALAVLLALEGSDPTQVAAIQAGLKDALAEAGLRWETRTTLTGQEAGLRLVIILPPDPGAANLAASAPQVQFLAVGLKGLTPTANLSLVGAQGERLDQIGFTAGYLAAMITPDWRVGALAVSDNLAGKLARQGFWNGAVYFCGLCLAYHGPTGDYPVYVELPASATPGEWQAAAQQLIDKTVRTVYITPGAGDETSLDLLLKSGAIFIGSQPIPDALRSRWAATVVSDPLPAIQKLLPDLLTGKGGGSLPMPVSILEVNPNLVSPGRLLLAEKMLDNLLAGLIDTGLDPLTGEPH